MSLFSPSIAFLLFGLIFVIKTDSGSASDISENQVPIGFVYLQLPNQEEPEQLWPNCIWESITNQYEGLFFRAEGGDSGRFGETQNERTNRITQLAVEPSDCHDNNYKLPSPLLVPDSGWSKVGRAGWYIRGQSDDKYNCEGIKVETSGGETRPINTAIRIWKRVA